MKNFILIGLMLFLYGCSKPKIIHICGDHECVNKEEAKQYFEENLTLEVQIVDKKNPKNVNLVELNMNSNINEEKKISLLKKKHSNKILKKLSKNEINEKKVKLKKKKISKRKLEKKKEFFKRKQKTGESSNVLIANICNLVENCNIEEISKFLINEGKNKKFPNINIKE